MRHLFTSFVLLLLFTAVAAYGQGSGKPKPHGKNASPTQVPPPWTNVPPSPPQPNNGPTPSALGSNLANTVANVISPSDDDHVPCFFNLKQLMDLRPSPSVPKLTAADQSRVLTSVIEAVDAASDKELTRDQKTEFIHKLAGELDGRLVGKTPGEALATLMDILYQITAESEVLYRAAADKGRLVGMLPKNTSADIQQKVKDPSSRWFVNNDPKSTLKNLSGIVEPELPEFAKELDQASDGETNALNGAVASTARSAINKLTRPNDIGCAYQILPWDESRLLFGRSVANNFIAAQVTVRNLNAKEEFIIHNAMLSVDTDIHGAIGRYFEGTDKISVEAYNNAGESLTPRGIVGNAISAASALLSTLQPIADASNFSHAVAVFTGSVVPGWKTMAPDHQKDQLLLIANSGFSATYTTKTVVGKSGAATFYTWFPMKPFLEGWWVQDCAQSIVTVGNSPANGASPTQLGVDLAHAQQVCAGVTAEKWKTKAYKDWSSISDQLFRDLSLAVVAGVHVQEESKTRSSVTDLKCPTNSRGELDLSQASTDGTFTCKIQGENLDKVLKLRLENARNAVDPVRPEANVTVSGDNTAADAKFRVTGLASATGLVYNVYTVAKDGTEVIMPQTIQMDLNTVTLASPGSVDLTNLPNMVDLSGRNLNKLTKLCLVKPPSTDQLIVQVQSDKPTEATANISSLKGKLSAGDWQIFLEDCLARNNTKQILKITGTAAPQIDSFTPASAKAGATVTIIGSNLAGAMAVSFGGVDARPTTSENNKITVIVPSGGKFGVIGVTTLGGTIKSNDKFTVMPKPKAPKTQTRQQ